MKCAILQHEAVHEEVIPSFVNILNSLNIEVDVYLNEDIVKRRGDIFKEFDHFHATVYYVELNNKKDWEKLKSTVLNGNYDFVYSNTFQRAGVIDWIVSLNKPTIGLVHNVNIFSGSDGQRKITDNRNDIILVTLASHVSKSLEASFDKNLITPYIFEASSCVWPEEKTYQPLHTVRKIGIPGGVNFSNRDFDSLISSLERKRDSLSNIKFVIMGGGKDRERLEKVCQDKNLSHFFEFLIKSPDSGMVLYDEYVKSARSLDFVDPLSHDDSQYGSTKITSAVPTALGFSKPVYTNYNYSQSTGYCCFGHNLDRDQSLDLYNNIDSSYYEDLQRLITLDREIQLQKFKIGMSQALKSIDII